MAKQKPFLWGSATSAHQVEGDNQHSDWWQWEKEGNIAGGITSGAAADHWNRSREDLALAKSLGHNTYRFSVEWAKLEPKEGIWDEAAFAWYSALLDHCEANSLLPMITLHHFTLPAWLASKGGFSVTESIAYFTRFTREVVKRFGSRIPLWCPFNEPMVLILGSYLGKFMPPAKDAPELVAHACRNILQSHASAYKIIHEEISKRSGPFASTPIQVGIAHNMLDFLPDRVWHPIENIATRGVNSFYNDAWLDALTGAKQHFGVLGLLPMAEQVESLHGVKQIDFIGVNYYTKGYVRWWPRDSSTETVAKLPLGVSFARRNEKQSDLGWALHPKGFSKMVRKAASFGLPIYITENGIADKNDSLRPEYITSHLLELAELIEEGIDIRGYYHWSLLDNFEWIKGFGPRFGLIHVNYETFERTPKASAYLYRDIIQAHGAKAPRKDILLNFVTEAK